MSKSIQYKPDATCECCGKFGAFDFGDEFLCSDCYSEKGSCCLEFGEHDLWKKPDKQSSSGNKEEQSNNN